ncbi:MULTISPECIES: PhaM family polyhydroxyalkanoate granule multifunctional regulatory protein [unclassified Paraburkholderia]|uniref:PhaM family polyhydroxyalkanoate granule multifunctional regulatory protein n=1 Tax=unclassified Paraburkholderia TaxID=2615204 RepID=UPI002AB0B8EB|nr:MULTISPECIES: PhaM family polyhydroxyalkanoate granule multifunctional regulatory protein [unclassified Paraburkholderia]
MTDSAGAMPPFPGFPGFPPAEMLDRMWGMMRLTPFGSAFPGSEPGAAQGLGPSLSMMSDMMTPLTNIEELDKRITDLRAVEQWLKLNLSMLQSAIQALEVQRATLSTLRAFGAFAQSQMSPPPAHEAPARGAASSVSAAPGSAAFAGESAQANEGDEAGAQAGFDASGWWNLLQSQFNQLAQFAMAQPAAAAQAAQAAAQAAADASAAATGATGASGAAGAESASARAKPAAKRSSSASGATASKTTARSTKKAPARPE